MGLAAAQTRARRRGNDGVRGHQVHTVAGGSDGAIAEDAVGGRLIITGEWG